MELVAAQSIARAEAPDFVLDPSLLRLQPGELRIPFRYRAEELGNEVPDEPLTFMKPNTSVIGPHDPTHRFTYWVVPDDAMEAFAPVVARLAGARST